MLNLVLWLNTIVEGGVAVGMFSSPASFFPGASGVALSMARAFAFAILAVAFMSGWASRSDTAPEARRYAVVILVVYHVLQLLVQFVNAAITPPLLIPPVILHTILSTLLIAALVRKRGLAPAHA